VAGLSGCRGSGPILDSDRTVFSAPVCDWLVFRKEILPGSARYAARHFISFTHHRPHFSSSCPSPLSCSIHPSKFTSSHVYLNTRHANLRQDPYLQEYVPVFTPPLFLLRFETFASSQPSRLKSSRPIRSTTSSRRSRTRRGFRLINSV
jgi:hypothetical protein